MSIIWISVLAFLTWASLLSAMYLWRRLRRLDRKISSAFETNLPTRPMAVIYADANEKLDELIKQLHDKRIQIARVRNEREAVLSEMREGVIAVNNLSQVFRMNKAAFELLGAAQVEISRTPLESIITHPVLLSYIQKALQEKVSQEREIQVGGGVPVRTLHLYAKSLLDGTGSSLGVLIVMRDISRLRRLEELRSDFVANVSHELKTPVTSIQGFAETLLNGALDNREEANRFINIISRQAERLNSIINDLLTLSELEQNRAEISLSPSSLTRIVTEAIEVCSAAAQTKQIVVTLDGQDFQVVTNQPLLIQAVINLVDNAIKYSDPRTSIKVTTQELFGGKVKLSVADQGHGIAAEHIPHLFERFYRVDKSRSRKQGGTGLGLAIVKHIMQIHGGSIDVTSIPGKGSIFSLTIPKA